MRPSAGPRRSRPSKERESSKKLRKRRSLIRSASPCAAQRRSYEFKQIWKESKSARYCFVRILCLNLKYVSFESFKGKSSMVFVSSCFKENIRKGSKWNEMTPKSEAKNQWEASWVHFEKVGWTFVPDLTKCDSFVMVTSLRLRHNKMSR